MSVYRHRSIRIVFRCGDQRLMESDRSTCLPPHSNGIVQSVRLTEDSMAFIAGRPSDLLGYAFTAKRFAGRLLILPGIYRELRSSRFSWSSLGLHLDFSSAFSWSSVSIRVLLGFYSASLQFLFSFSDSIRSLLRFY